MGLTSEIPGRRCPRCGSTLITNGLREWCTFVGGGNERPCTYGIDQTVKLVTLPQPTIPQDGRSRLET